MKIYLKKLVHKKNKEGRRSHSQLGNLFQWHLIYHSATTLITICTTLSHP